jgi:hypothetical protein
MPAAEVTSSESATYMQPGGVLTDQRFPKLLK